MGTEGARDGGQEGGKSVACNMFVACNGCNTFTTDRVNEDVSGNFAKLPLLQDKEKFKCRSLCAARLPARGVRRYLRPIS
jgi:hypothetical protein